MEEQKVPPIVQKKLKELEAIRVQREKQQGLGRNIVSLQFDGYRLVAVGSKIYYSKNWITFHDFLFGYIKDVFGTEWGNAELQKPLSDRHAVLQWYDKLCRFQREYDKNSKGIYSATSTGAVQAYLSLAYNLYLIAHNVKLQELLIKRLKDKNQFYAAYYETFVAAVFIKAGFDIEFEDEANPSSTHCEFTATHRKSSNKYSIEAKSRQPNKESKSILNQLHKALKKDAAYKRIVFIDMNVPIKTSQPGTVEWLSDALKSLRVKESTLTVGGAPAPEAYIFVTNTPNHLHLDETNTGMEALAEGFKIPDFKFDAQFPTIRDEIRSREKHKDIHDLKESLKTHDVIPSTFDGEIPEFEFGDTKTRLIIGQQYLVPNKEGKEVIGTLMDGVVFEKNQNALCVYQLEDGSAITVTTPLSEEEVIAYQRHPDTFFGEYLPKSKIAKGPLDMFDFFYENYGKYQSKDKLLDIMKSSPDIEQLRTLDQKELAEIYCERLVYSNWNKPQGDKLLPSTD